MKEHQNYCYLNGKILPTEEAFVSVYDIGLLRGYGVYDGLTVFGKKVFRKEDHLKRFRNSAESIGLSIPISDDEISTIMSELLDKNNFDRTNLRMILTGGDTLEGIYPTLERPTFYILCEEWKPLPNELYLNGGKLITFEHQRNIPEAKTTNYINAVKLQPLRLKSDAIEILFFQNGLALECSTSNAFAFMGDTLVTPQKNILGGITRKVVLELAQGVYKTEERDLPLSELLVADEVFITSSYKDIVPIVKIDEKVIGQGIVGSKTKHLMDLFQSCIKPVSLVE